MEYLLDFVLIIVLPVVVGWGILRWQRRLGITPDKSSSAWPWHRILAFWLVGAGLALFLNNAEALSNGNAVDCDGDPMRPGQVCMYNTGFSNSYDEEKRDEAWGELAGYAGVGAGILGIVLFISGGIAMRSRSD
jgi:hypothetical protein